MYSWWRLHTDLMFNQTRWLQKYMLTDFQIPCSASRDFFGNQWQYNLAIRVSLRVGNGMRWAGFANPVLSLWYRLSNETKNIFESRFNLNSEIWSRSLNFLEDVSLLSYVTDSIINDTSFTYGWYAIYLLFIKQTCHTHMTEMSDLCAS